MASTLTKPEQSLPDNLQKWTEEGRTDPVIFAEHLLGMKLHDGQKKYLRQVAKKEQRIYILSCGNRWGKAQGLSAPILTPTGWQTMGDMQVGSAVMTQDGSVTQVTDIFPQGKKQLYKLTFDDGSNAEATAEHLWKVMTGISRFNKNFGSEGQNPNKNYKQWKVMTTQEILDRWGEFPSKRTAVAIPVVEPMQFPQKEVTIDPYTLGAILGDGGITTKSARFTTADQQILDEMDVKYRFTGKYSYHLYDIAPRLKEMGLMGFGSLTKFVPQDYLWNSKEVRLALLQGLMDTDGSINTKNKKIEFNTISPELAKAVEFLVQSFGGKVRTYTRTTTYSHHGEKKDGKLCYRLSIAMNICPFRLERKVKLFQDKKLHYTPNRILKSIEKTKIEEAQCIRVAHPSHLYITKDFIVTHNSVLVSVIQLWHLFYKFGIPQPTDTQSQQAWEDAEYRTANIAPHSANTEAVFKTIHAIMTSTFQVKINGLLRNNECIIGWFYLQDRTLNTPPYKQFFYNNSYIEHRSLGADQGGSLQGKPYGLITYDEGGRSDHLFNEIEDAIKPRLFDWHAPLHVISTPSQDSKSTLHYYELFQNGLAGIKQTWTMTGALDDNTFFAPEEIEAQKEMYRGSPLYGQVINGEFAFGGDALFSPEDIIDAQTDDLNDGIRREDGHKYCIGTDTAIGHDEMVHYVLDTTALPFKLVRGIHGKGAAKSPQKHLNDFIDLCDAYHDKGNLGHILETWNGESVRFYHDLPPWIQSFTKCYGSWRPDAPKIKNDNPLKPKPNNAKKADILLSLRKILADKNLKIPSSDQKLSQQLQIYREDDKNIPTDRVMALALAVHHATADIAVAPVWAPISW